MIIWSLFDGSGIMVKPWADAGHKCYCFNYDGANHGSYEPIRVKHENIEYINCWINGFFEDYAYKLGLVPPDVSLTARNLQGPGQNTDTRGCLLFITPRWWKNLPMTITPSGW